MPAENTVPMNVQQQLDEAKAQAEAVKAARAAQTAADEVAQPETAAAEPETREEDEGKTDQSAPVVVAPPAGNTDDGSATVDDEKEKLQHALDVLKGKYSAEVPRLAGELRKKEATISDLESRLQALEQGAPPSTIDPDRFGLTDEEKELGADVVSVAGKVAARELQPLRQELARIKHKEFLGTLAAQVPDFAQINESDEFAEFASRIDPIAGVSYDEILTKAESAADAARAAAVFLRYKAESGNQASTAKPLPKPTTSKPSLEAQAVPTARQPGAVPVKKVYSLAEFEATMTAIARGDHLPEKAKQLRLELETAIKEGRVKAA
jgi:hypothetical protein